MMLFDKRAGPDELKLLYLLTFVPSGWIPIKDRRKEILRLRNKIKARLNRMGEDPDEL